MSAKTIRMSIADMLDDLSEHNLEKFCHQLLDRREEPLIRRTRVEGKSRLQIVDVLVSTFMEQEAAQVSVDILRQINCNEEAQKLARATGGR
ncbi:apoptosis-associated speck-like protein containing a CARD [Clinocottus analis]|uniref:apoptosis-associated speck-like protein containing a CARD n=1 Tax=Clinocottus analis TaxID=304258 RepID=UPI0035BF8E13